MDNLDISGLTSYVIQTENIKFIIKKEKFDFIMNFLSKKLNRKIRIELLLTGIWE